MPSACAGLRTAIAFEPASYPGYEHRRTLGFDPSVSKADNLDISKGAKTFVRRGRPAQTECRALLEGLPICMEGGVLAGPVATVFSDIAHPF